MYVLKKLGIGIEFAVLLKDEKRFQFWKKFEMGDERSSATLLLDSKCIVYFYQIDEQINEETLKFIKKGIQGNIPMIFVRYDSDTFEPSEPPKIPKIPEELTEMNYQNFEMIGKFFEEFNLMYVSTDRDSMILVLNKIVELNDIKQEKCELK